MLITNYSYINKPLGRNHSGITNPRWVCKPEVMRNFFTQADITNIEQIKRDSFPTGTNPPYSYVLGDKGGLLSASTTNNGSATIAGNISQGINIDATLAGTSDISTANLALVVQLAAALAGDGQITAANLVGTIALAATLTGTGNLTAGLNVIAFMTSTLAGTGGLTATLRGTLDMSADIFVNQSEATVQQLIEGVWNAMAADYNNPNTMGEIMNNLGSVADPWSTTLPGAYAPGEAGYILGNLLVNIPDAVWDELKTTHTTASSYGKIVQDLETIAKQIKGLTAANL